MHRVSLNYKPSQHYPMSNDLSARPEWQALTKHRKALESVHMRDLFSRDLRRFDKFSARLPGFTYDFSKNKITDETIPLLCDLARSCNIEGAREALYSGAEINTTEKRAALHMALRGSQPEGLKINGEDVAEFVNSTLVQIKKISQRVRADRSITDVIHIGIGGSDLGPRMVCRALCEHADGPDIHFLANIDGQSFAELARKLKPKNTLVIVCV
jgi:glucose-6-phosphate isomerase